MIGSDHRLRPALTASASEMEAHRERVVRLVEEESQGLMRYLAKRGASRAVAEDVRQEAFLQLAQRDQFLRADDDALRRALYRYAGLLVYRERRSDSRRLAREQRVFRREASFVQDPIEMAAERLDLTESLAVLSPRQRSIVLLMHFAGWTIREVSEQLGISVNTARTHYERARKVLGGAVGD